ncbi:MULTISPECIES: CHAT domain-containing protein [Nostoc]|uniref:CHAT domain-containing protein n=1 Tax=Nostoc paludosum FACHB-159 TaxID=2692908 RepID=A0ABR8KA72_9NOSO|nr:MULTISPECIES: CHAT domain-containing protein [Nostoc]MBD2680166.1 CHAT domain-containing protein [Nostoc sp. FACHB-857]MBD2736427.1 CHAT domain-containing protein [Nostoc paludosum FACHB-159]
MPITQISRPAGANSLKVKRQKVIRLSFYFLMGLLCILSSPVLAKVPSSFNSSAQLPVNTANSVAVVNDPASLVEQGKVLYDAGNFAQAAEVLQKAVQAYQQQGENLRLAATLSNLSLAYQQLGKWSQAQQAITESLNLLQGQDKNPNLQIFAQSLDIQGRLQLAMGRPEAALATWQQTEEIYQQADNKNGVVRSLINQAQAWQAQGFYPRAIKTLDKVNQTLKSQPDSIEKTVSLRSLGDALLVIGDLKKSHEVLEESLKIARNLQSKADISASLFSLGNNALKQQDKLKAIDYYQQTVAASPSPLTKVQAQLNHLSLLIEGQQWAEVQTLLPSIQSHLDQLPLSRASIYAQINYAQNFSKVKSDYLQASTKNSSSPLSPQNSAELLARAIEQSRNLGDKRAEAYAFKSLGGLYEQTKQWSEAQDLTLRGLAIAQSSNAPEITYALEWQLGRLLWAKEDIKGAIAAYDAAVDTLQSLRKDLVVNNDIVNQDVQFNFRDSVEPVYRQSVELLLQSQQGKPDEKILEKARQRIEALQLAELDDFFREACLQGQRIALDQVVERDNQSAAILYPIILPEELQVIVKIPKQPLQNYTTKISHTKVEELLVELRRNLVNPTATKTVETQSQQVYNWLLKPIESELQKSGVNTLVFVLDGVLRNIPMSALYDGKQYLVEKYAVALSVGLQLLDPKPLVKQKLVALTAGLTQPPPGFSKFAPLLGIKSEFDGITKAGVSTTSLLDGDFKKKNLETEISETSFNIVHLATHGQFSSRLEDTFILDFDGQINVKDFDTLFRNQSKSVVELLVLSACQTATGDSRAALGLAGAAVRAGARSTIASLWQIDDKSTAMFVSAFYQELKSGKITKAEAVHRAQLKLLKHPNYKAPSFWSSYVLIGNWL